MGKVYPFPTQNTDGQFVVLRRNIVKKYISLILALTILVGMLGVSAMAFAEDPAPVTVNQTALNEKIAADETLKVLASNFSLNLGDIKVPAWLATEADISALFSGANFVTEDGKLTDASDKVEIQYFKPGSDRGEVAEDKDSKAGYAAAEEQIDVNSVGWWSFRFVVVRPHATTEEKEGEEAKTTYSVDYTKDIVAKSQLVSLYAQDVDNPIITLNQTRYDDYTKKGITVGTRYSIPTTLLFTMTDDGKGTSSSYITVYYVIEKMIDGNWTAIYDSSKDTKVLDDKYSDFVSASGILAGNDDVSSNSKDYKYRVKYSFKDQYGYTGVDKDGNAPEFVLNLYVNAKKATEEEQDTAKVWQIVLYVIAGLAAVGIVVLLCIKPKQEDATTIGGKVHYGDNDDQQSND